jgi:hypothetical protein
MKKNLFIFYLVALTTILYSCYACNNNQPKERENKIESSNETNIKDPDSETLLGIELGKPLEEQVNELMKEGKINYSNRVNLSSKSYYVEYDNYLMGGLVFHTIKIDGKDILQSVVISFADHRFMNEKAMWLNSISFDESSEILSMYIKKYGNGKEIIDSDIVTKYITHYKWEKKKIIIEYIVTPVIGSQNVRAMIEYRYNDSIQNQLMDKSNNEKI